MDALLPAGLTLATAAAGGVGGFAGYRLAAWQQRRRRERARWLLERIERERADRKPWEWIETEKDCRW